MVSFNTNNLSNIVYMDFEYHILSFGGSMRCRYIKIINRKIVYICAKGGLNFIQDQFHFIDDDSTKFVVCKVEHKKKKKKGRFLYIYGQNIKCYFKNVIYFLLWRVSLIHLSTMNWLWKSIKSQVRKYKNHLMYIYMLVLGERVVFCMYGYNVK